VLVERVRRRTHRPLLNGRDPRLALAELMVARRDAYAQAPLRVATSQTPHKRSVDAIIEALQGWTP